MLVTGSIFILFAGFPAFALNDWSQPCLEGRCSWDMPTEGGGSGNLQLWGGSQAISDITPAAGWTILDCDANKTAQDIRVVCTGANDTADACQHLLDGGAEGKIVRLTDSCGSMPFARVAKSWIPADQSIPASMNLNNSSAQQVRALSLDTDFHSINSSVFGGLSFAIQMSSIPNKVNNVDMTTPAKRRRYRSRAHVQAAEAHRRQLFVRQGIVSGLANSTSFNESKSEVIPPFDVNQAGNVFNASIHCGGASDPNAVIQCPSAVVVPVPFDAAVSADVDARAHAEITLGVVATGTIVPPNIDQAAITAGLTGSINSTMNLTANADAAFSSPSLTIFELPLAGVVIPGILSLGPVFQVTAQVTAKLQVGVDIQVGLTYAVDNATLVFPPDQGTSGGSFSPLDTPLSINTNGVNGNGSVTGDVNITGHLVPGLSIGVDAFSGLASATVSLTLDASATLELNGTAQTVTPSGASVSQAAVNATGCADVRTALDVSANANAGLFGLFSEGTSVSLFSKTFQLFSTCADTGDVLGSSNGTKSSSSSSSNSTMTSTASAYMSTSTSSSDACISQCASSYAYMMPAMASSGYYV